MIVYVTTQGARVVREGRHLLVTKGSDVCHTLFVSRLEQLVLCGNITLTTPALDVLMREEVDTVFLRQDGRYRGRLASSESKNVYLRKRQFQLCDDPQFCLEVARSIVRGKLGNMLTVLQRVKRTRRKVSPEAAISAIRELLLKLPEQERLDSVRGIEGAAAARYFEGLRAGFDEDHGFYKRVRRPPTDPVNSVLSLLYTFLINRMYAAIRLAGLDPYPGVLHALDYGRHALPLDLVEEFRAPLADALTLALFNLKVLQHRDFYIFDPPVLDLPQPQQTPLELAVLDPLGRMSATDDEANDNDPLFDLPEQNITTGDADMTGRYGKGAVRLHSGAFKKVINAFEKKLQTQFHHPLAERRMSYAEAMVFQARYYRRVVEGEVAQYQPLLLR